MTGPCYGIARNASCAGHVALGPTFLWSHRNTCNSEEPSLHQVLHQAALIIEKGANLRYLLAARRLLRLLAAGYRLALAGLPCHLPHASELSAPVLQGLRM